MPGWDDVLAGLGSLTRSLNGLRLGGGGGGLDTSAITLISHAHGRARRDERGIVKRELQEAVKYGRKERANPGRNGDQRWRYTHKVCALGVRGPGTLVEHVRQVQAGV